MNRGVWFSLLMMTMVSAAPAETYYVATDGQPENDGTLERPWPSVEHALAQVGGGHTIVVRPGLYGGAP